MITMTTRLCGTDIGRAMLGDAGETTLCLQTIAADRDEAFIADVAKGMPYDAQVSKFLRDLADAIEADVEETT